MFPGQGSQSLGMVNNLQNCPPAMRLFEQASNILEYDLLNKCIQGPKSDLDSTAVAQPAIFVASMAALEKLKIENPAAIENCILAMGLSLGEYSALCFAGVISFEDGVKLTKARGEAMQRASELNPSSMLSVSGLGLQDLERACQLIVETYQSTPRWKKMKLHSIESSPSSSTLFPYPQPVLMVANHLSPSTFAVSGHTELCDSLRSLLTSGSFSIPVSHDPPSSSPSISLSPPLPTLLPPNQILPLDVAGAFHTPLMGSACPSLRSALNHVRLSPPRIPVLSNVTSLPHPFPHPSTQSSSSSASQPQVQDLDRDQNQEWSGAARVRELLVSQVISPVQWEQSLRPLLSPSPPLSLPPLASPLNLSSSPSFSISSLSSEHSAYSHWLAHSISNPTTSSPSSSPSLVFYEVGPGSACRSLVKRMNRRVSTIGVTPTF